jgi:hypothetical protein
LWKLVRPQQMRVKVVFAGLMGRALAVGDPRRGDTDERTPVGGRIACSSPGIECDSSPRDRISAARSGAERRSVHPCSSRRRDDVNVEQAPFPDTPVGVVFLPVAEADPWLQAVWKSWWATEIDPGDQSRPHTWINVKVVPHLPGSAASASASRRSDVSSCSLTFLRRRDSSATLN